MYDSVILKDITQRNKVRDIDLLRRLILFFLANAGNSFSLRRFPNMVCSLVQA